MKERTLEWRWNPTKCVTDVFGVEPDPWQHRVLHAALVDDKSCSIRSGHGVGKTAILAFLIYTYMLTRFPTRIPCMANSVPQLEDVLWPELGIWHQRMAETWRPLFIHNSAALRWAGGPDESFAVARGWSVDNPESKQGFHGENVMRIYDEASGIPDSIFEAGSGAMTSANAIEVLTGNPTRATGYFYDSHHKNRVDYHTEKVSCLDSPRVAPSYYEKAARKYGRDSNYYRVRVLGEFPLQDDDAVISLELCESAVERDIAEDMSASVVWGVDVGRFGDDASALCKRRGPVVHEARKWHKKDTMATAGIIWDEYQSARPTLKPDRIFVDVIGIGAGVVDRLKEMGAPVTGVNVAESASAKPKYLRLRDELWWKAREWLETKGVRLPRESDELIGELTGPTWKSSSVGKIEVESKANMKKRGLQSPDLADAFCLTFMRGAHKQAKSRIDYSKMHKGVV